MNPRRHARLLLAIGLTAGLLLVMSWSVISAMSAGSIEGQDGWSGGTIPVSTSIDQAVDHSGVNQRTGTGAWRISNNTSLGNHNGALAGWPFGPGLPVSAGQPSSGAVADQFTATLWFRSASASADGSNIEINLGSVAGDDRNTFLALTNRADGDGGLQLRVSEPDGATGNFRPTAIIATGITRSVWHRLDILARFLDGEANDTVEYALDGVPLANPAGGTTFGTFEGWRDGLGMAYVLSNRLHFRSGAPPSALGAFVDTAAQGFYFDDLFYSVEDQAAPALRLAAYATGFEPGFSAGSIEGQEAWSGGTIPIPASVDQTVDLSGLNQRTGTGAWRISNNTSLGNHNGAIAGWPFGPGLPVSAGQPSSGAVADQFTATLWFRSASASADGSNIEINLGSVAGDDRNTFLALTNRADGDGGLQLRVSEPDGATGNFRPTAIIATGITRSVWHRLDILARFLDGEANDTVEYALDGVPLANPAGGTTFGTFEGWRDGLGMAYVLSNRLHFRSGSAPSAFGAFVDTAAQGFYFDDLSYAAADQSAPATSLAAYATGFEPPAIPAPDLDISKTHVGDFTQGQIGAQLTITVTNIGTPSTIGVVTMTDTVPTGLTPAAASGAGWTCGINGAAVTCTRSDALAPGASYPPVTITVNVATNAPASVANTAIISGGGDVNTANNTATDVITIRAGLRPTTLTLALDPATVQVGSGSVATAMVIDGAAGASNPAGTIVFNSGGSGDALSAPSCTLAPVPAATDRSSCQVTVTPGTEGPRAVTASYAGERLHAASTAPATLTATLRSLTYLLSEGVTGAFFDTNILLANPNASPAPVEIAFLKGDGTTVGLSMTLLPTSRTTIHVADIPGLESAIFSTQLTTADTLPLVMERTTTWDATGYGAHTEKASSGQATTWYFAEGSQGYFHTYFLLVNPQPVANAANVTYLFDDGTTALRTYPMLPTSRLTLDAAETPELVNRSFGATITFDHPGMAERAMYFDTATQLFGGGSASAGITVPSSTWHLAEGATGAFFNTFLLIVNPGTVPTMARVTYLLDAGGTVTRTHPLEAHQRLTLNVALEDPLLANASFAMVVDSAEPVVVERSLYWPVEAWHESHNSTAVPGPRLRWGLAEGEVGGPTGAQTYILVGNGGSVAADLTVTFLRTDGTTVVKPFTAAPNSRLSIAVTGVGSAVPELEDESFATIIQSTQPVVVERSVYIDAGGTTWAAGTNATASPLP